MVPCELGNDAKCNEKNDGGESMIKIEITVSINRKDAIEKIKKIVPGYMLYDIYPTMVGSILIFLDYPRQDIFSSIVKDIKDLDFINEVKY